MQRTRLLMFGLASLLAGSVSSAQPGLAAVLGLACLTGSAWAAPAVASPAGDPLVGATKAEAERCQECHGVDGHGIGHSNGSEGRFPKLAGQAPDYILKQIRDFRSGARKHDVMTMMARSVEDADVADIAAYFASRPPMKGDGSGANPVAEALYQKGDSERGIAACVSCHGPAGKGLAGVAGPVIGGQEWRYLEKQFLDWRTGERSNSPGGAMNQVAKSLSDAEIRALSDYLSGLP